MNDERDRSTFPSTITVNVVVSGHVVVEFLSTTVTNDAKLKTLTDSLATPTAVLQSAVNHNPVPTP
jgi:hypothetical protein